MHDPEDSVAKELSIAQNPDFIGLSTMNKKSVSSLKKRESFMSQLLSINNTKKSGFITLR